MYVNNFYKLMLSINKKKAKGSEPEEEKSFHE